MTKEMVDKAKARIKELEKQNSAWKRWDKKYGQREVKVLSMEEINEQMNSSKIIKPKKIPKAPLNNTWENNILIAAYKNAIAIWELIGVIWIMHTNIIYLEPIHWKKIRAALSLPFEVGGQLFHEEPELYKANKAEEYEKVYKVKILTDTSQENTRHNSIVNYFKHDKHLCNLTWHTHPIEGSAISPADVQAIEELKGYLDIKDFVTFQLSGDKIFYMTHKPNTIIKFLNANKQPTKMKTIHE